ncbi:SIR2 family NAD-dependent protein deacylase [Demequina capsici]|uniref:protein acetyllysine N-acetyltransferase n=1 Tax=Demequina capsici TaxID=3075620 RepID=A0AA96F7V4_9MICO|nr:Sir2 family NAD-dependent protein deacetylase [Demequina sp. OYTSA14]WNM24803.1 Sir2 family NAD-dependent protein deacetylase [Demequina sp. OYTSA14]
MTTRVTVLTGAGVSTGAGIPDFRGPRGVWTLRPDRARLLEIDVFMNDRALREEGWRDWREHPAWQSHPTDAHRALARLGEAGVLEALLTQNIDGLHQAGGSRPADVIELHGALGTTSCMVCGAGPMATADVLARLDTEPDPRCAGCGGILKPDVVYFGEPLPPAALDRAVRAAEACDVMVAIGTTLTVFPVASLPGVALDSGASLVLVNAEPTAYDRYADEVVREPIETAVPSLVERWLDA